MTGFPDRSHTQSAPLQITVRSTDGRVATTDWTQRWSQRAGLRPPTKRFGQRETRPMTIRRITTRCTP